jgi:hypothetical protein
MKKHDSLPQKPFGYTRSKVAVPAAHDNRLNAVESASRPEAAHHHHRDKKTSFTRFGRSKKWLRASSDQFRFFATAVGTNVR